MKHSDYVSAAVQTVLALALITTSQGIASETMTRKLEDFDDTSVAKQWRSVNDDVMGGISEGAFRITDDKTLVFSGVLHLLKYDNS